jgi:penicillin-binding protein 1A
MVKMMQGVIASGTARRLNSYNIPVEKAGKTGTTQSHTDGWFIGYTPQILAGTWVGCEDPFIPIYPNGGGAETASPKWGIFMSKVYADKSLSDYTSQKEFTVPTELRNDPIFADSRFNAIVNSGDSLAGDNGNGDAGDFIQDETDGTNKPADTVKSPKKEDKKDNKPVTTPPAAIKPAENKAAAPKPKPKTGNDY